MNQVEEDEEFSPIKPSRWQDKFGRRSNTTMTLRDIEFKSILTQECPEVENQSSCSDAEPDEDSDPFETCLKSIEEKRERLVNDVMKADYFPSLEEADSKHAIEWDLGTAAVKSWQTVEAQAKAIR